MAILSGACDKAFAIICFAMLEWMSIESSMLLRRLSMSPLMVWLDLECVHPASSVMHNTIVRTFLIIDSMLISVGVLGIDV